MQVEGSIVFVTGANRGLGEALMRALLERGAATELVSARDIIAGYRQLIARAHQRGIRVIGTTITPFEGRDSHTPDKEVVRQAVNSWIRSSAEFDAVVDFDSVLRDPSHPPRLLPAFDSGDHLHTNDAGYVAMASAIPLALFEGR